MADRKEKEKKRKEIDDMLADDDYVAELQKKFLNEIQQAAPSAAHPLHHLESYLNLLQEEEIDLLHKEFMRRKTHKYQKKEKEYVPIPDNQEYHGIEPELNRDDSSGYSPMDEDYQHSPEATSVRAFSPCREMSSERGTSGQSISDSGNASVPSNNLALSTQNARPSLGFDDSTLPSRSAVGQRRCPMGQCTPAVIRCENCHYAMNNVQLIEGLPCSPQDMENVEKINWHLCKCLRKGRAKTKRLKKKMKILRSQCEQNLQLTTLVETLTRRDAARQEELESANASLLELQVELLCESFQRLTI